MYLFSLHWSWKWDYFLWVRTSAVLVLTVNLSCSLKSPCQMHVLHAIFFAWHNVALKRYHDSVASVIEEFFCDVHKEANSLSVPCNLRNQILTHCYTSHQIPIPLCLVWSMVSWWLSQQKNINLLEFLKREVFLTGADWICASIKLYTSWCTTASDWLAFYSQIVN